MKKIASKRMASEGVSELASKSSLLATCYLLLATCCLYAAEKPTIKAKQVEFQKNEEKVIFTGDVVVTRGNDVLYADNAVKDEKTGDIVAWGNVKGYFMTDSSETARLTTGRVRWETESDRMLLSEFPQVIYVSTSTGEIFARADNVIIENAEKTATFSGNVIIEYGKNTADSNSAKYFYSEKKIIFLNEGGKMPFIRYSNHHRGDFRAEKITVYTATRNMLLEKNAQGLIYQ